jgi:DNA-binding NarL/FixJ family response regulator
MIWKRKGGFMNNAQRDFLRSEFAWLSLQAAFQHAGIYAADVTEENKIKFKKYFETLIDEISKEYAQPVSDSKHEANILRIKREISDRFGDFLQGGCLRIGVAQKAFNLYLKYLWCAGEIHSPPPNCPFDSLIISKLSLSHKILWTKLDSIDDYRLLVKAAREKAEGLSLSEWELEEFKKFHISTDSLYTSDKKIYIIKTILAAGGSPQNIEVTKPAGNNSMIRLLIVDDITRVREDIKRMVQSENDILVVGEARTGVDAVGVYEETRPDVVISNICMPDMDGIGSTFVICHRYPDAKVIICSVQSSIYYMKLAMYAGAYDFIPKPPGADELLSTIRKSAAQTRKENLLLMQNRLEEEARTGPEHIYLVVPKNYIEIVEIIKEVRNHCEEILRCINRILIMDMGIQRGSQVMEIESRLALDKLAKSEKIFQMIGEQDNVLNKPRIVPIYQLPPLERDTFYLGDLIHYEAISPLLNINWYSKSWQKWKMEMDEFCPLMKMYVYSAINILKGVFIDTTNI